MRAMVMFAGLLILVGLTPAAQVVNPDTPKKGEYRFPLREVWSLEGPGDGFWGDIYSIIVSDDGRLCVYDWKTLKYHILDETGQLLHTFGRKGEGPGEIRRIEQAPLMNAGDRIAVIDEQLIHYFDWSGKYLNTARNITGRPPVVFLDEHTLISAPRSLLEARDTKAQVERVDLKSGRKEVITSFSIYDGGVIRSDRGSANVVFGGITPMVEVAIHEGRLIYGVSDTYRVTITGTDGKVASVFSVDRPKARVKRDDITRRLVERAGGKAPRELLERLAATLPTEQTYFSNIEVHGGLIYVFTVDFYATHTTHIDIFSFQGEYLYRGVLAVDPQFNMLRRRFAGRHAYLVLEDEEGEQILVKYTITLPATD
ncbi:MAG: 6-bladed beta-propeller [Acidobacteriota bacterium]|jgi:hypothetical protein|nr:6-bladed beta-propeller [Acidobacteriota bacterium]